MHPFTKRLYDQIGSAWYREVKASPKKIALGTVRIVLTASPDGKVTKVRILSNTSSLFFARLCFKVVEQTKIPPIPADLLTNGEFRQEISFTIYPQKNRPNQSLPSFATSYGAAGEPTAQTRFAS